MFNHWNVTIQLVITCCNHDSDVCLHPDFDCHGIVNCIEVLTIDYESEIVKTWGYPHGQRDGLSDV